MNKESNDGRFSEVIDSLDITQGLHRGNTTEQTQAAINTKLNKTLQVATNQAADQCLDADSAQDQTRRIKAPDTVLYDDPDALNKNGNPRIATQSEQYQHVLIQGRREANHAFDTALNKLSPQDQAQAIRVMNFTAEQIYQSTRNDGNVNFLNSPDSTKNSIAEQRISEAKQMLAEQINNGAFMKNLAAYANNGMQTQCAHKDADVVDYSPH